MKFYFSLFISRINWLICICYRWLSQSHKLSPVWGQSEVNRHNSLCILCNITFTSWGSAMQTKSVWLWSVCRLCCTIPWQCMNSKKIGREQLNIWNIYGLVLQIILEIQGPCGLITEQVLLAYIEIMGGPHFQWNVLQRKKKSTKYSFPSTFLFFFKVWYPLYTFPHCVYALEFIWRWFNEQSDSRICFIGSKYKNEMACVRQNFHSPCGQ